MDELVSTMTDAGQVTVPPQVRRHLGLAASGQVVFVLGDDGSVRLRPVVYPTIASLQGAAGSLPRPLTWHEMREIADEDRFPQKSEG